MLPSAILPNTSSREILDAALTIASDSFLFLSSITDFMSSCETANILSPALGTCSKPSTLTAAEGPASLTVLPLSSIMARTRPVIVPDIMLSPVRRVPFWMSTVATGPLPLSSWASMTAPRASLAGLARSSFISATRRIFSKSSSMPWPVLQEIRHTGVSPPHSSGTRP